MRRTEHYTVSEVLYSLPESGVYRQVFHELPFFQRIYLKIRAWLGSTDIDAIVREHELDDVRQRASGEDGTIVVPSIPALRGGFFIRARPVAEQIKALKPVLVEARGSGAGPFLRDMLERLDVELFQTLDAACVIPEELLKNAATTAATAKKRVHEDLLETLEIHKGTIREHLEPVWASLESLALLMAVDMAALLPTNPKADMQIPMRPLKDQLVQLACTVELCVRNKRPDSIRVAADTVTRRTGKRFAAQETIWDAIDALDKAVSLVDLARLAADEPRLELARLGTSSMWWQRFTAAWVERIDVQGPLLRYRSLVVEDILRNHFGVSESTPMWIPPSLYQRSVGALRRLSMAQRFRDTRTMVGALAREQSLLSVAERARILEAHVELDKAYNRLEELTGVSESRGAIGDELRRLRQTSAGESLGGVHKKNVYSKHRPELFSLLGQAIDAFTVMAESFSRNKPALRKALKTGAVRIDLGNEETPPVDVLELITEVYYRLAIALRSLMAMEQELTSSTRRGADEDGEEGEVPEMEDAEEAPPGQAE